MPSGNCLKCERWRMGIVRGLCPDCWIEDVLKNDPEVPTLLPIDD